MCVSFNSNQWHAITWFYEWILISVEGVEVQEKDARSALTRSQMICALRYKGERSKLSKIPPPWIVLWSRMVGSWPSLTFGGCRFVLQARIWFKEQLRMLQRARIMWKNNLVIQRLTDKMEFTVNYIQYPRLFFQPGIVDIQGTWSNWFTPPAACACCT